MERVQPTQGPATAGSVKIISEQVCVVYHSEAGNIVHVHRVTNLEGSKTREVADIQASAIELALKLDQKRERSKMKTLFVPPEEFTQFDLDRFEVDLHHKKLAVKTETKGPSR
jgi:hypothetical protein